MFRLICIFRLLLYQKVKSHAQERPGFCGGVSSTMALCYISGVSTPLKALSDPTPTPGPKHKVSLNTETIGDA